MFSQKNFFFFLKKMDLLENVFQKKLFFFLKKMDLLENVFQKNLFSFFFKKMDILENVFQKRLFSFFLKNVWNKEKHVGVISEGEYKLRENIDNVEER